MDFNDLALRLERVYTAIGERADGEVQKYIKIVIIGDIDDPKHTIEISFNNGQSDSKTTDIIFTIIEHLAKLKDHLKNKLGIQKQFVEDKINESFFLRLIIDLSNSEKHGYPLTNPERTGKSPRLQNIRTSLMIPPQEEIGINIHTGEVVKLGNCRIVAQAEVVEKDGELICMWYELVDGAIKEWEGFIKEHHIM